MTEIQQQQWRFLVERARETPDLMRVDPALIVAVAARLAGLEASLSRHLEDKRRLEARVWELIQEMEALRARVQALEEAGREKGAEVARLRDAFGWFFNLSEGHTDACMVNSAHGDTTCTRSCREARAALGLDREPGKSG